MIYLKYICQSLMIIFLKKKKKKTVYDIKKYVYNFGE